MRIQRRSEDGYGNRDKNGDKGFDKLHNDSVRRETCNKVYGVTVDVFIFSSPFYIGARNLLVIKPVMKFILIDNLISLFSGAICDGKLDL